MVKIGSKYAKYKSELVIKIKDGSIDFSEIDSQESSKKYACFFCYETITDNIIVLKDDGECYVDETCYNKTKFPGRYVNINSKYLN